MAAPIQHLRARVRSVGQRKPDLGTGSQLDSAVWESRQPDRSIWQSRAELAAVEQHLIGFVRKVMSGAGEPLASPPLRNSRCPLCGICDPPLTMLCYGLDRETYRKAIEPESEEARPRADGDAGDGDRRPGGVEGGAGGEPALQRRLS